MTYHFYFKNSEPVYETEYKQSLKQFAVQEVFPASVLKEQFLNSSGTLKTVPKLFICCVPEQMFLKCSRTCISTNEEHFKNFKMSGNVLQKCKNKI